MEWAVAQIDSTGLANVSVADADDWARAGMGGHNIAANSLLFHTLVEAGTCNERERDLSTAHEDVSARLMVLCTCNERERDYRYM